MAKAVIGNSVTDRDVDALVVQRAIDLTEEKLGIRARVVGAKNGVKASFVDDCVVLVSVIHRLFIVVDQL